jgi:hypothetical protein
VDAAAAVALPVTNVAGEISAIVGIAYSDQRQFSEEDLTRLEQAAGGLLSAPREGDQ